MTQSLTPDTNMAPDVSQVVIEDDTPVDNLLSEKQQRLLTEPLYSNPQVLGNRPFLALPSMLVYSTASANRP